MDPIIVLLSALLISIVAPGVFIWSMRNGVFGPDSSGAKVIFTAHEVGHAEDPAAESQSLTALQRTVDLKRGHTAAPTSVGGPSQSGSPRLDVSGILLVKNLRRRNLSLKPE